MAIGYRDGLHPYPPVVQYSHMAVPSSRQAVATGTPMSRPHATMMSSPSHPSQLFLVALLLKLEPIYLQCL